MMTWDNVKQYAEWYMRGDQGIFRPPENPLKITPGKSVEFILHRMGQFQAELVCLYANVPVQRHLHPDVDAREFHICGKGLAVVGHRTLPEAPNLDCPLSHRFTPILAGVVHHGVAVEHTVAVSCQHWKNGVPPTFITDNWRGVSW